ncbi:MarR family transcriptional regulator [Zafaria cholistanensis]|uniref:MarR family transcriptional regulator n=1 Tax=Zafaria cholistanensis TaxID=1682741 RepID=A0A5A7NR77_9MICC|nr:MarR family transcriptional regulator [Zafaria cholistanensis]GER23255.1 MarR family transcriptional regulator [Zafaria cholistanensis]
MPYEDLSVRASKSGDWHPGSLPDAIDVLNLLRAYRRAESRMRSKTRDSMGMGETDLAALRYLLRETQAGRHVRQRDLAQALEISNPSVSGLVDRLCRDGYAERVSHPEDRRSVAIRPTQRSEEEAVPTLEDIHQRELAATESLTSDERATVAKFLTLLRDSLS